MLRVVIVMAAWVCLAGSASAETTEADSVKAADTLMFDERGMLDGTNPATSPLNFETRLTQNPTVALFKSMAVPGWGQLGNKKYFKAVLYAGLDAWFVGAAIHYGRQASDYRDRFESAIDTDVRNRLYDLYLDRKDERNKFTWFAVIITFVAAFDAYADAHLSGYPSRVDEGALGLKIEPTDPVGVMASITYDF